jgi:hypothetical protein
MNRFLELLNTHLAHYTGYKANADDNLTAPDPYPTSVAAANQGAATPDTQHIWMDLHPIEISFNASNIGFDLNTWYDKGTPVAWTAPNGVSMHMTHNDEIETQNWLGSLEDLTDFVEDFFEKFGFTLGVGGKYVYAPLTWDSSDSRPEAGLIVNASLDAPSVSVNGSGFGTAYYEASQDALGQTALEALQFGAPAFEIASYSGSFEKDITLKVNFSKTVMGKTLGVNWEENIGKVSAQVSLAPNLEPAVGFTLDGAVPSGIQAGGKLTFDISASGSLQSSSSVVNRLFERPPSASITGTPDAAPFLLAELLFPFKNGKKVPSLFDKTTVFFNPTSAYDPTLRLQASSIGATASYGITADPKDISTSIPWTCWKDEEVTVRVCVPTPWGQKCYTRQETVSVPSTCWKDVHVEVPAVTVSGNHHADLFGGKEYVLGKNIVQRPSASGMAGTLPTQVPVDLLAYDGQGRAAGIVEGAVINQIPGATVDPLTGSIIFPSDVRQFAVQVLGSPATYASQPQSSGTYDLVVGAPIVIHRPDGTTDITYASYRLSGVQTASGDQDNLAFDTAALQEMVQQQVDAGTDPADAIQTAVEALDSDEDGEPDIHDHDLTYARRPTTLSLSPLGTAQAGGHVTLMAHLLAAGVPASGAPVNFILDDAPLGQATTDVQGRATLAATLPNDLGTGDHRLSAEYPGDFQRQPSQVNVILTVIDPAPAVVFVRPTSDESCAGTMTVEAYITDTNLSSAELFLDGQSVPATLTEGRLTYSWNTAAVSDGPHVLTVRATDVIGQRGVASVGISVDNGRAPATLSGLTASASDGRVTLFWLRNREGDLAGYRLERRSGESGPFEPIGPALIAPDSTSYADTGLVNGRAYSYRLIAVDSTDRQSAPTAPATAIPGGDDEPPAARIFLSPPAPLIPGSTVLVTVQISEPLAAAPTVAFWPPDGSSTSLALEGSRDAWFAELAVPAGTPAGDGHFTFLGYDLSGNQGTTILEGETVGVDPTAPGLIRLADLRADADGDTVPDRFGEHVTVQGVAAMGTGQASTTDNVIYLQDGVDGMRVVQRGTQEPAVRIGDLVRATGVVTQMRGETVIEATSLTVLAHDQSVLWPLRLDLASLAEDYEGRLVHVSGVVDDWSDQPGGRLITLHDASGTGQVWIDTDSGVDLSQIERSKGYHVVGVVTQNDALPPYDAGYRVMPRHPDDVRLWPWQVHLPFVARNCAVVGQSAPIGTVPFCEVSP